MRYLVKAKLKPNKEKELFHAIETGTLGRGSIAWGEYVRDMSQARLLENGLICWLEVCYCSQPLEEELPYWQEYFEISVIKNSHNREKCKDLNGTEPWACGHCDCTEKLESRMEKWGELFIDTLKGV